MNRTHTPPPLLACLGHRPALPPWGPAPCPAQRSWKNRPVPCSEGPCPCPRTPPLHPNPQEDEHARPLHRWEVGDPCPATSLCRSSHPVPFPVPPPADALGVCRRPRSYDIKCSCAKTWPQSNYTEKQEEPFRLIWLFCPGLPRQPQRDAQEGWLSGWAVTGTRPCAPRGPPVSVVMCPAHSAPAAPAGGGSHGAVEAPS